MSSDDAHKYRIETISDFLALTPEQRVRCVKDLLMFGELCDLARELGVHYEPFMTWIDDGRHNVHVHVTFK